MAETETAEQYQARLTRDWDQFTAVGYCYVDGVLAATPGTPIPASHPLVSEWLESNLIARNTTKAAKAATEKGTV
jgi:hypothetical protein